MTQRSSPPTYSTVLVYAKKVERIRELEDAIWDADAWWWHEAHGLHDDAHHFAHGGMVACVPLLTRTPELQAIRENIEGDNHD